MAGGARRGSGHCRLLVMAVVMRVARRVVLLMVAVLLLLLVVAGLGAVKLARRQVVAVALSDHLRRTASLHPARRGRSSARREEAHNFCGCGGAQPWRRLGELGTCNDDRKRQGCPMCAL